MGVKWKQKRLADGRVRLYLKVDWMGKRWQETPPGLYLIPGDEDNPRKLAQIKAEAAALEKRLIEGSKVMRPSRLQSSLFDWYWEVTEHRDRSWQAVRKYLLAYQSAHNLELRFADLTPEFLGSFRAFLLSHLAQSTAHLYWQKLGAALDIAVREKILVVNPLKTAVRVRDVDPIPEPDYQTSYLTVSEIERLCATPYYERPDIRAMFLFSLYTGLRPIDLKALRWSNIRQHGETYSLTFTAQKTSKYLKDITVKLRPEAVALLGEVKSSNATVFAVPSNPVLNKHLRAWGADAGIPHRLTWKVSRHTFATLLHEEGTDILTIAKTLGHRQTKTSERYAKVTRRTSEAAIDRLPSFRLSN